MLLSRITTALLLVVLFLAILFFTTPDFFCFAAAIVILIAGWEWASISEVNSFFAKILYECLLIVVMLIMVFYAGLIFGGSVLISPDVFLFWFF